MVTVAQKAIKYLIFFTNFLIFVSVTDMIVIIRDGAAH